ncbi:uncharacterized protein J4E92_008053 [Alternaria infectoria]|uniref:uncharacterized protein n=1 Tax=Alternaria infectoria TaxID=45303 RepID=UPI00221F3026|nr:uncharacterized protein J4E92_008053 [Alternaria infectoria]KAI4921068.1 hypothetical protein J4E92_008053 [Alternaria infectoria]
MSTAAQDTAPLRLRQSLYQFVQDAFVAARVSTDNWPQTYEDDDEVNAATAEGFIAERLGALQRGIEQQRQEAKEECDKSIRKGSEAMNALVSRVGGGEAECTPTMEEYGAWMTTRRMVIEEGINNLDKTANDAVSACKRTTSTVDDIFQDLFHANKVDKPEWKISKAVHKATKLEEIEAADDAVAFFRSLPAKLALGIVDQENSSLRLKNEVLQLKLDRNRIVSDHTEFVRSVYEDMGLDVSQWRPPTNEDDAAVFKSWLQERQIEFASRWKAETKAREEADEDFQHYNYGVLIQWIGRKFWDRIQGMQLRLDKDAKLEPFDIDETFSSWEVNRNNIKVMSEWLDDAGVWVENIIRERSSDAMIILGQRRKWRTVAEDAVDRMENMRRTIAMAKKAVFRQYKTIAQLRTAST